MELLEKNKKYINFIFVALVIILFFIVFAIYKIDYRGYGYKTISIAGQEIKGEIAKTPNQKSLGLGQRKSLSEGRGMLFVYDEYLIPSYWMKGMEFPIDIIWIKDDMVAGYEKDLKPQVNGVSLPTYQPKTFINYVLEVNSGFVDKYGLKIGDSVEIGI